MILFSNTFDFLLKLFSIYTFLCIFVFFLFFFIQIIPKIAIKSIFFILIEYLVLKISEIKRIIILEMSKYINNMVIEAHINILLLKVMNEIYQIINISFIGIASLFIVNFFLIIFQLIYE